LLCASTSNTHRPAEKFKETFVPPDSIETVWRGFGYKENLSAKGLSVLKADTVGQRDFNPKQLLRQHLDKRNEQARLQASAGGRKKGIPVQQQSAGLP